MNEIIMQALPHIARSVVMHEIAGLIVAIAIAIAILIMTASLSVYLFRGK